LGFIVTLIDFLMLAGGGFLAGVVNSVAGGCTFLSFAAMIACGLNALEANATSAVAITPSNLATVAAYRNEVKSHWREFVPFAVIGVIGGAIGAGLLIWLGNAGFKPLVPWLLLFATLLFAFSGPIRKFVEPWSVRAETGVRIAAYGLMVVVSIYGGFFGAGIGFVILAALLILEGGDYHKANAIRITIAFLIQAVAAVLLIFGGLVHWPHAIVTMIAASVGGYYGVGWAKMLPDKIVRAVVVAIGAALTVIFFVRP
jgi:uncharacterized membrane protein YfcA